MKLCKVKLQYIERTRINYDSLSHDEMNFLFCSKLLFRNFSHFEVVRDKEICRKSGLGREAKKKRSSMRKENVEWR